MQLVITIGNHTLPLKLHTEKAPRTCAALLKLLPFQSKIVQARWSGESCWVPMGDLDLKVPLENQKHEPAAGQLLFHPKDVSETEILVPYGLTRFASKFGPMSGNHFATIDVASDLLYGIGQGIYLEGAQSFAIKAL